MDKRGGGVSRFPVEIFLFHSAEKCRSGTSQSFIDFGYRKSLDESVWGGGGGGSVKIFRRNFLVSVPKTFVVQPFRVSLISGIEKIYASECYVTIFCRNFLSHSDEKVRRGTLVLRFR